MEMTFTNPFEIITENVIFGLDTIKNPGNGGNGRIRRQAEEAEQEVTTVKIPKYNNYMKKVTNNLIQSDFFGIEWFKSGSCWPLFQLFSSFQTNITIFTTNICEKMSTQNTVVGFKLTTFRT